MAPERRSSLKMPAATIEFLQARSATSRLRSADSSPNSSELAVRAEIAGPLHAISTSAMSTPISSSRLATFPSARRWRSALASSTWTTAWTTPSAADDIDREPDLMPLVTMKE